MNFPEKEILLKDGRTCLLRPAAPEDAAALIDYMKITAGETPYLLRYPDEVTFTEAQEAELLSRVRDDPRAVMLLAVVDGELAGCASFSGAGAQRKVRHRCRMAIALCRAFWRLGIGAAMVGYLKELAGQMGYTQMELEVYADNAAGLALYKKCGFTESGRLPGAVRLDDGSFRDYIIMYTELKHSEL